MAERHEEARKDTTTAAVLPEKDDGSGPRAQGSSQRWQGAGTLFPG